MQTAREYIADAVERAQLNWNRMLDMTKPQNERDLSIAYLIHFSSYIVLLETLRRHDEALADRLAQWINDNQGGETGEWLWQWREDLAAGRPLSLPNLAEGV